MQRKGKSSKRPNVFKENDIHPPKVGNVSLGEIHSTIYGHGGRLDYTISTNKLPTYELLVPNSNSNTIPRSKSLLVHSSSSFSWISKYIQDTTPPISPFPSVTKMPISSFTSLFDKFKIWSVWSLYQLGLTYRRPYEYYPIPYSLSNSNLIIKSFSCHPSIPKIAVALEDHSIHIYVLNGEKWEEEIVLFHEFQKNIFCLEWKPLSGNILAVGCSAGVLIWEGDWVTRYLTCPSISNICSLHWSPIDPFIAVGCPHDSVIIWDISTSIPTRLHSLGPSSSHILQWSPDGSYLFQGLLNGTFIIWETMTWKKETWNIPKGMIVQSVCWSPDSHYLAYSLDGKSIFYILEFNYEIPNIKGEFCRRIPLGSYTSVKNDYETISCGRISQLLWNKSGDRFMVTFCSSKGNNSAVALFSTSLSPSLEFRPIGFLRIAQENPQNVKAQFCDIDSGSLVIFAANGILSTVSLIFNHSNNSTKRRNLFA